MKKVVLINQSAGYLTIDIANAYSLEYEEVVLIAGTIETLERELDKKVHFRKIIAYNRSSISKRVFSWFWAFMQIFFLLLYRYRYHKVIYFTNPPISYLSSLLLKNKFSVVVYDIYPDALKNIGFKKNNLIFALWSKWNKILFRKAEKIITISESMAEQLKIYTDLNKIKIIPNWSGSENFRPIDKDKNNFISDNNLKNKFIVMYSGNIGYTHSIETLIEVAVEMKGYEEVHFLIIGEGMKKVELMRMTELNELKNLTFLTWQPAELLLYSLASADLAVISLNNETALLSAPSKTYNLLAIGAPLLCIAPVNSALASLVKKYDNGICLTKDNITGIKEFITMLSKNNIEQKRLSENSLRASRDFTYLNAIQYV